ncbi:hypothetical protein [Veillonella agrestimuris]|uniref:hypothetical protein n=1 Tax=Veillonella agrestimuris TaxID=2941340 RepID=UPI00203F7E60|nr:hypothetical protein [Veillonella agrestimuris]
MNTNQNKSSFHRAAPSYLSAAIQWVDSLTYPEITEQIVMYNAYLKTYEDSYSNIIGFLPLMLTVVQLSFDNDIDTVLSHETIMILAVVIGIISLIILAIACFNKKVSLGYIAIMIPLLLYVQFAFQNPSILVLVSFIMLSLYFGAIAHYKPQDMKNHIILELLKQRKALIESSNPASEIKLPKNYKK